MMGLKTITDLNIYHKYLVLKFFLSKKKKKNLDNNNLIKKFLIDKMVTYIFCNINE